MEHILTAYPLNEIEQRLKNSYQKYPERHLDQPCNREDIDDIIAHAFSVNSIYPKQLMIDSHKKFETNIQETTFIPKDMDIAFVRHMRYTPAFWHQHEFFELLFVLEGTCQNIFSDRSFELKKGDICIHAPGTIHTISAFQDNAILVNILVRKSTFDKSFLGLMEPDNVLSNFFRHAFYASKDIPYLLFHTKGDSELVQYIKKAEDEYHSLHRYRKQMINAVVSEFFIRLLQKYEHCIEVPNIHFNGNDNNLMFILRYMQSNYTTVTLKELSSIFNYSPRQLQRIILSATGMTFTENIQKQKIEMAARLLMETNKSVSEIGESLGYSSLNNFRKIFKKYFSVTPSEYRTNPQ